YKPVLILPVPGSLDLPSTDIAVSEFSTLTSPPEISKLKPCSPTFACSIRTVPPVMDRSSTADIPISPLPCGSFPRRTRFAGLRRGFLIPSPPRSPVPPPLPLSQQPGTPGGQRRRG